MSELSTADRLQPSLLDRLTDDNPGVKQESRDKRIMSMRQLRAAVLRDLEFLLNASGQPRFEEIHQFPYVAKSVINYGIPDMTGLTTSGITPGQLERVVIEAIHHFEPRIVRDGLSVRAIAKESSWGQETDQKFEFEITGDFCPLPMPESLYVRTEVDLETGRCEVRDKA
jgi:type VI secretion system protein ImpF